jgi:hypothetical protein
MTAPSHRARPAAVLAAGVVAGAVLAGCAEDGSGPEAATGSSAAPRPSGAGTDLSAGLLPAAAFGAAARVTPVTGQQLAQGAAAASGSVADARVTVPSIIGLVRDGDRLVTLVATDTGGGTPDQAAFTTLLQQAHDVQAEQLD